MNNVFVPKECNFLKICVFSTGTLKGRKSALATGIPSPIVIFTREVQPAVYKPSWLVAQKRNSTLLVACSGSGNTIQRGIQTKLFHYSFSPSISFLSGLWVLKYNFKFVLNHISLLFRFLLCLLLLNKKILTTTLMR